MAIDFYYGRLKNFLKENIELLQNNDFTSIYKIYKNSYRDVTSLTELFLESGINPLEYMTKVPAHYAEASKLITEIAIPKTITIIEEYAFSWCVNLQNAYIPKSIKEIKFEAFNRTGNCIFTYEGTKEEFLSIQIESDAIPKGVNIHCLDGDLFYVGE